MVEEWKRISDGLWQFRDSCIVYALDTGEQTLIINSGTGAWLNQIDSLPHPPVAVALTHAFRDHSEGAIRAARQGIAVWAPRWERELLEDAPSHFARRETYIIYDNAWDRFCPTESVPVGRWLHDWETIRMGEASLQVLPTPGASPRAVSFLVTGPAGRGLFAGEAIHSRGKLLRIAPLQYDYNGLPGAENLLYSIDRMAEVEPEWIASSTGADLITEPLEALEELRTNLIAALTARGTTRESIAELNDDGLIEITPHLFRSSLGVASSYFLISESGKCLVIDYGYRFGSGGGGSYPFPRNRRPLEHGLRPLKERFGIDQIDAVLVTHFHDDHVCGIPELQRRFQTKCFASETFAHILADPEAYAFPCTWPEPIQVTALPNNDTFRWEEYEFSFRPMSGHTRYSTLIAFEADGLKVVATGDQYFFQDFEHPGKGAASHNHVYQNGAMLSSMRESAEAVRVLAPELVLPGHGHAYRPPAEWIEWIDRYTESYEVIHRSLMPLDAGDVHFEVDSRAGWLEPYRTALPEAQAIEMTAHVRNPFPQEATLELELVAPDGWEGATASITLRGREEGSAALRLVPPAGVECRRQPIALSLSSGGRQFGQIAEAIVTIGSDLF